MTSLRFSGFQKDMGISCQLFVNILSNLDKMEKFPEETPRTYSWWKNNLNNPIIPNIFHIFWNLSHKENFKTRWFYCEILPSMWKEKKKKNQFHTNPCIKLKRRKHFWSHFMKPALSQKKNQQTSQEKYRSIFFINMMQIF